jgi:hypothetical protein
MPQLLSDGRIGFLTKSGRDEGIGYTQGRGTFPGSLRSPAWSPGGNQVVYEKVDYSPRPQNQLKTEGIIVSASCNPAIPARDGLDALIEAGFGSPENCHGSTGTYVGKPGLFT